MNGAEDYHPPQLSVLDQAPVPEGTSRAQALRNSLDLALHAEQLGYHRYWLAEHHGTGMLACASPEAIIGPIAALTSNLRVGSGGVMLPHYSPVKVAETFSLLAGLFPGRIDLGIGRAPGSDQRTAYALQRDRRQIAPDDFPEHLTELIAYLEDRMSSDHPFANLTATLPGKPERPDLWLLGSSPQSGIWAAELGLPYMFADFINPEGAGIVEGYRRTYAASGTWPEPHPAVAVSAICAETDEEAKRLSASIRMALFLLRSGDPPPVPPVDKALEFLAGQQRSKDSVPRSRRLIAGRPSTVRSGIESVAREYGASEVMIVTIVHDHEARRRSYELIAREFGLAARNNRTTLLKSAAT